MSRLAALVLLAGCVASGARSAYAQPAPAPAPAPAPPPPPPPTSPEPRPWQVGVTDEARAEAQRWLDRGNELFVQNLYKEALEAYERGLASWDHPAIRFNVARALIALDRPIDALAALEVAMAHGAEPLADVWAEAVNYRSLLHKQIGSLTVRCIQPDVTVSLDGEALPPCPIEVTRRVEPGRHVVVGRKDGFLTLTRETTVIGGACEQIELSLVALRDAAITRTRWPVWKPWAVVGAGAAVAGLGVALELDARGKMDDYREALAAECGERGCPGGPSASTTALADEGRLRNRLGTSMLVVGGLAVASGVVLVIANRPRTVLPPEAELGLAPMLAGGAIGVSLVGRR